MASALTAGEIANYRKSGHWKKYFLAVAEYHVVFTAELAAAPASNDMVTQIEYVNEAYPDPDCLDYSDLSDIRAGMTLYVGSTPGAYDLGMARIRKTPVHPYLYIGETSEIDWTLGTCILDTIYLTVVDDYQLRAKPLKMLNDVAYMDVDLPVGTNHTTFDPVPIMGGHRIAVLDETTGLASVTLGPDANTAAWVLGSTIASVLLWEVPGAVSVDNLAAIRPVAVFDTPGTYPVYCTFTARAGGKTAWGVRYVIVYDHSTNRPITDFAFQNKNVSYDAGGWSFEATVNSHATKTEIRDHSLCILFSENYIDGNLVQRTEPFPAYQSVETTGYITRYSITRNWEKGNVNFTVEGAQGIMKKMEGFPSGLEFKIGAVSKWTDMPLLTVTRMIWHFLHWRTTATRVMDVILPPDTLYATAFNSMQKFLWDQIVEIAQPALFASPGVDCYGRFFLEVEPQMTPETSRTWPTVMTFVKSDWQGDMNWDVETEAQVGILVSAGLKINSTKTPTTFFSLSPGHVPKQYGGDMSVMNNVPLVASQSQSNSLCGLYAGWKNNPYKRFEVSLRFNFKAVDLWPRQFFGLTIDPADDPRGVGYSGNVIPREITFEDDRNTGFEYPIISFEAESFPQLAVNGDIPINTTTSIEFPSLPDLDLGELILIPPLILPLPDTPPEDYKHCLIHSTNHGLFYTDSFNEVSPTWVLANSNMDAGDAGDINMLLVDNNAGVYISFPNGSPCGSVRYAPSPLSAYSIAYGPDNFLSDFHYLLEGDPFYFPYYTDFLVNAMGINKGSGEIGLVVSSTTAISRFVIGSGTSFTMTALPPHPSPGWGDVTLIITQMAWAGSFSYGGGKWLISYDCNGLTQPSVMSWDNSGDNNWVWSTGLAGAANGTNRHCRLGSSGSLITSVGTVGLGGIQLIESSDNFTSQNLILSGCPVNKFACDTTGKYLMGTDGTDVFTSSDGGYDWGHHCLGCAESEALTLPVDFPASVWDVFCIDKDRWIVIGKTNNNGVTGNVIIYTDDFGATWQSKVGNLATMYPDNTYPNLALDLIQAWA